MQSRTRWTSRGLGQELSGRWSLEAKEKGGTLGDPSKEEVPGHLGVGESHSGVHVGEQDSPASHIWAILLGEPSGRAEAGTEPCVSESAATVCNQGSAQKGTYAPVA